MAKGIDEMAEGSDSGSVSDNGSVLDPEFERAVQAGRLAVFYLTLPQFVQLPPSSTFTEVVDISVPELAEHEVRLTPEHDPFPVEAEAEGKQFVSLRFWHATRPTASEINVLDVPHQVFNSTLPKDALPNPGPMARARRGFRVLLERFRPATEPATVVEAVSVLTDAEDPISDAFDRCLSAVVDVVRSYRIAMRDPIRLPTMERLPFLVPYFTRNATIPFRWEGPFMFLLHYNSPRDLARDELADDFMARIFHAFDSLKHGNPMIPFSEHGLEARLSLERDGDYADAVIHSQTALESLLDNLLTLMFWEEGKDPMDVAVHEFVDVKLTLRVQRNLPPRLGGNWDPRGAGPIGRWRTELAFLRNQVVHRGYVPTRPEARRALEVASGVSRFVFERLVLDSAHRKSALLSVGLEGFEQFGGGVTEEMRVLAASDNGDWLDSYSKWRSDFEDALASR